MNGHLLTRREIMALLPQLKNKNHFFNICANLGINRTSEKRERHIMIGLYSPEVINQIKKKIEAGDGRKWK